MKQQLHRHGCRTCQKTYEDGCDTPSENDQCYQCRTGRPGLYDLLGTWTPRQCCLTNCRSPKKNKLAKVDEFRTYDLSPSIPWWICDSCGRTFPYRKPRTETA